MTNHSDNSNGPKQTKNAVLTHLLIAGTSACLADAATFPFDTAKVRLQLQGESAASNVTQTVQRLGVNKSNKLLHSLPKRSVVSTNAKNNAFATTSGRGFISTAFPIPAKLVDTVTVSPSMEANTAAAKPTLQYRGLLGTITTIARQEGTRSLYNGLSAGLQRQMVFASVRLGMYDTVKGVYQKILNENPDNLNVIGRICAGLTTGAMAVIVGQPTEVVKIRFQGQKRIAGSSLQYTSTPATYRKIGREEGIRGLWKGATPNIGRNAVVNVSEIVCYDIVKDCLIVYGQMRDNIYCHFTAAVVAGFAATVAASPVDVIKTRYMNSPQGQYRGAMDCAMRMAKQEGFTAFYKGFVPGFARLVSWNICLWISYEQMKKLIFSSTAKTE